MIYFDLAIVSAFIVAILANGFMQYNNLNSKDIGSTGADSIKKYFTGGKNFSDITIISSIIASWICVDFLTLCFAEVYQDPSWFLALGMAGVVSMLLMANGFGPRMKQFLGNLSVAGSMEQLYREHIQIVTGTVTVAQSFGMLALQAKMLSCLFINFFGLSEIYALYISSGIIVTYCSCIGIKSSMLYGKIQWIMLLLALSFIILIFSITYSLSSEDVVTIIPFFESNKFFIGENISTSKFFYYICIFFFFVTKCVDPASYQKALLCQNTHQIQKCFNIAAVICFIFHLMAYYGIRVLLETDPHMNVGTVITEIINGYKIPGLRAITIIAIMGALISSGCSWLTIGSASFAHDMSAPWGVKISDELLWTRLFAVFIGFVAIWISSFEKDYMELLIVSASFYMSVIAMPLILAIIGFRSGIKAITMAIFFGAIPVFVWHVNDFKWVTGVDALVPSMLSCAFYFFLAHLMLREHGGWVGEYDDPYRIKWIKQMHLLYIEKPLFPVKKEDKDIKGDKDAIAIKKGS